MSQTPPLAEVIEAGIDERLEKFVTALPANVRFWSHLANTVDIEIAITNATEDSAGNLRWIVPHVNGVPVLYPGSGKNRMTFPIEVGAHGVYIVSSLPNTDYLSRGGRVGLNVPSISRNNVCFGYFIPGLYTSPEAGVTNMPSSEADMVITPENKLKLGADTGTSPVALLSTMSKFMQVLGTVTDTAGACAQLKSALELAGWPGNFVSSKVEGK